jgi:Fe2+ transport system protein FeoA
MSLDKIKTNQSCSVVSINSCSDELRSSFYQLGVFPGVKIRMLHKRKSPLQIRVGHSSLCSIRRNEAKFIEVKINEL